MKSVTRHKTAVDVIHAIAVKAISPVGAVTVAKIAYQLRIAQAVMYATLVKIK